MSEPRPATLITHNIEINTPPLTLADPNTPEQFGKNINGIDRRASAPSGGSSGHAVQLTINGGQNPVNIHIRVLVEPAENKVACFLTDSEGNFLLDSAGKLVTESGSDDGTLYLVVNKKNIEVATNPGQFYFNLLWWNEGGPSKTVNVNFTDPAPTNLSGKGANSVHSALFQGDTAFSQDSYNCANDGSGAIACVSTPHGSSGNISSLTVPPDATLLVTYHFEWAHLGKAWSAGCDALGNCPISATGKITNSATATVIGDCTAAATGTRK